MLNSKDVFEVVIPLRLNPLLKGVHILDLDIAQEAFKLPGIFDFEDVKVAFFSAGKKDVLTFRHLHIDGIHRLFTAVKEIEGKFTGLNLQMSDVKLEDADASFHISLDNDYGLHSLKGVLTASALDYDTLMMTYLRSDVVGDSRQIRLEDFVVNFSGGVLQGQILLDYQPKLAYSIKLIMNNVDLNAMGETHPEIFAHIQGTIEGKMNIEGDEESFHSIAAAFDAPQGGQIRAFLLKHLVEYLPANSTERLQLQDIIRQGGYVKLEVADGEIHSADAEHLSGRLHLLSQTYNLDITYPVDIYVEGGLVHVFDAFHAIAQ